MKKCTAIILVTYNGWSLTDACLRDMESLVASGEFVVAVADNCSSDNTVENICSLFPWVHLYPQKSNLGFGAANNAAIRGLMTDGVDFDAICLLNNDTRFDAKALANLREDLDRINRLTPESPLGNVVVPTTFNADGSRQNNFFAGLGTDGIGYIQFFLNAFRNETNAAKVLEGTPTPVKHGVSDSRNANGILETCWASAVCWMLNRSLWESSNGFDENIFMYYEDGDLALRLRRLGARFFISDTSCITHLGGGSASNSLSRALQHDRSQQYVFKKLFGIRGLLLSKSFRFTRSLVRILSALPRCIIGRNALEKREYVSHHFALLKESLR